MEINKPLGAYIAAQCPQVKKVYISPTRHTSTWRRKARWPAIWCTSRTGNCKAWLQGVASWFPERQVTVVYGHTHKADEWNVPDTRTTSYNLGSWVVERKPDGTFHMPEPRMLLIDDDGIVMKDLAL